MPRGKPHGTISNAWGATISLPTVTIAINRDRKNDPTPSGGFRVPLMGQLDRPQFRLKLPPREWSPAGTCRTEERSRSEHYSNSPTFIQQGSTTPFLAVIFFSSMFFFYCETILDVPLLFCVNYFFLPHLQILLIGQNYISSLIISLFCRMLNIFFLYFVKDLRRFQKVLPKFDVLQPM